MTKMLVDRAFVEQLVDVKPITSPSGDFAGVSGEVFRIWRRSRQWVSLDDGSWQLGEYVNGELESVLETITAKEGMTRILNGTLLYLETKS